MFIDQALERTVVATILAHPPNVGLVSDILSPDMLTDHRLQALLRALFANNGTVMDLHALAKQVGGQDALQFVEGVEDVGLNTNWIFLEQRATQLAKLAKCRDAIRAMAEVRKAAAEADADVFLEAIAAFKPDVAVKASVGATAAQMAVQIQAEFSNPQSRERTPTGTLLDDMLAGNGLRRDGMYVIGGLPGAGKSLIVHQSIPQLCQQGAVLLVSLEMGAVQVADRLLAQRTGLPAVAIEQRESWLQRRPDFLDALEWLHSLPLTIIDNGPMSIERIRVEAKRILSKTTLAAIIIDYLQLVDGPGKTIERLEHITRQTKLMAGELKAPVILLSSFNRSQYTSSRLPLMADFRGSGSIESDADCVAAVHRPSLLDQNHPDPHAAIWCVLKQRGGSLGKVQALLDPKSLTFVKNEV